MLGRGIGAVKGAMGGGGLQGAMQGAAGGAFGNLTQWVTKANKRSRRCTAVRER